jgi:hypothetical protein
VAGRRNMSALPLRPAASQYEDELPQKYRLQQLYEAALRRWGQIHEASQISGDGMWLVQAASVDRTRRCE